MTTRRTTAPAPPPGQQGKSQGPAHGQGLGIGLYLLSTGAIPGQAGGAGSQAAFPKTPILDNFNRADNASLGANWTRLNPGGLDGYTTTAMGIASNAAYDPDTSVTNKSSAAWTATQFTGNLEAYMSIGVVAGDWFGLALRAQNVNGGTVKYYWCQMNGASGAWGLVRQGTQSSETSLASGSTTALVAGDKIGGRVHDNASGNPVIELWLYRAASPQWTLFQSVTDSSVNKITGAGYIGMIWSNVAGNSSGRVDNFGGGVFSL